VLRDPANSELHKDPSAAAIAVEVASLQARLLGKLHEGMAEPGGEEFAKAARDLAEAFGAVTAASIEPLIQAAQQPHAGAGEAPSEPSPLHRSREMRRRLDQLIETYRRYGHPFGLAVFDIEGPGIKEANGSAETVRTVVGAALHDSVRLLDDTFRLEEDGLCVLAPNQNTVGGVQMAERLLGKLEELEAVGGMRIGISAGVVACPDHGTDAERLLQKADEGLWRARAVGEPVGVGPLQDRSQIGEIRP
jgi:diguanylate cyclase (GGDEF)-like protein